MKHVFYLGTAIALISGTVHATETQKYRYDAKGRLIKVERTGTVNNNVTTEYTHDKADNILENVRGLLRPNFSDYLDYIILQLSYPTIGPRLDEFWEDHLARLQQQRRIKPNLDRAYRVLSRAINAADYGAAQKRHRAIFIGISVDFGEDWSFPEATHSQEGLAWSKHVDHSYWTRHEARRRRNPSSPSEARALAKIIASGEIPAQKPWLTVRDATADLPPASKSEPLSGHWQHPGAKAYPNHTGSCFDEPAKALKAGDHGVPGGENMVINQRGNVRYFTVREMARLQGFPDDFVIEGSWKAATRQLGNAVPTAVAEHIGKAVKAIIQGS